MIPSQSSACTYRYDLGIHHFTLHRANAEAVDEFMTHLQRILNERPADEVIRLLVDLRPEGIPPIGYVFPALKRFFRRQSRRRRFKSAYLYRRGTLIHLLPTFLDLLLQRVDRRFFLDREEAEAIRWLLENET